MEWISLKDQIPPFEQDVLLYWKWKSSNEAKEYETFQTGYLVEVRSRKDKTGIVNYCEFKIGDDYNNTNPTHWALLEPPKQ